MLGGTRSPDLAESRPVKTGFHQILARPPTQIATDIGSEMALDNRPLTALGASEQAASLASLPEDLWRKIASLARPPTVRALVAACPDASLRQVLRTDVDRAERAAFGLTQREAERSLVDVFRLIQANSTRRQASAAFIGHIDDRIRSVSDYYGDSPYVNPDYTMEIARMFLQYGGSATAENAPELSNYPDIVRHSASY